MDKIVRAKEIYTPFEKIENGAVRIRDGTIVDIINGDLPKGVEYIEARDQIVAPGFIEVQVNGAGGADAMDGSAEKLAHMAETLARFGTTAFLPTIITAAEEHILRVLAGLGAAMDDMKSGAIPLGLHLEGPFLNLSKRGAHPAEHVRPPSLPFLERAYKASNGKLRMLALAPELEGALLVIRRAVEMGIVVALGHSDATYDQAIKAIDAGATHCVHIFNAMRTLHQREPGIIGAILSDDRIHAAIIADGVHVHPALVKTIVKAKGRERVVLSTDGTAATAMPDGKYLLGGRYFTVENGVCRDEEGHLAGSSLTQDRALRNMLSWTGLSLREALITATANPANVLGLKNKGVIAPGADADLVFLSSNLEVQKTMINGEVVYSKSGS